MTKTPDVPRASAKEFPLGGQSTMPLRGTYFLYMCMFHVVAAAYRVIGTLYVYEHIDQGL